MESSEQTRSPVDLCTASPVIQEGLLWLGVAVISGVASFFVILFAAPGFPISIMHPGVRRFFLLHCILHSLL
jgi:hypothetical protein